MALERTVVAAGGALAPATGGCSNLSSAIQLGAGSGGENKEHVPAIHAVLATAGLPSILPRASDPRSDTPSVRGRRLGGRRLPEGYAGRAPSRLRWPPARI